MALSSYKVGLVVGTMGINQAQVDYLAAAIKMIGAQLEPGAVITMLASASNLRKPTEGLPAQVKALAYKGRVHVQELDAMDAGTPVAAFLYAQLKDCDEIWCCPGPGQNNHSKARACALYQYAQNRAGEMRDWYYSPADGHDAKRTALRFKMVSPWVEVQAAAKPLEPRQKLKGKR
jgi:hypothetical protein